MPSNRLQWMDFTRGICILLIIFLHSSNILKNVGIACPTSLEVFNKIFEPYRMPLLMFISGMLLHKSLLKPVKSNIYRKFCLIFWPLLVWSMFIYAAQNRLTWEFIFKTPIIAPSILWYLWFLFAYYVLAIFIHTYSLPVILVIVACLVSSEFLPTYVRMNRFPLLFAFFLAGHYLATHEFAWRRHYRYALLGLLLAGIGSYICVVGMAHYNKYSPLFVWAPAGLILFVRWAVTYYASVPLSRPIEWLGRNSIVFYVVHFPVQVIIANILRYQLGWSDPYVFYAIVFITGIVAAAGVQYLRTRFHVVQAMFDFDVFVSLFASFKQKLALKSG